MRLARISQEAAFGRLRYAMAAGEHVYLRHSAAARRPFDGEIAIRRRGRLFYTLTIFIDE